MKKKDNLDNIELVVLNCFIRTIKTDGKYMLYRRGVKNSGIIDYLLKKNPSYSRSGDSPFTTADSTAKVAEILKKITNDMARSNGKKGGVKDLDKYEHVTMTINHLLHFFMEANGVSMQKLCSMGEEIYNLSCNKLFGDTLEDLEKQQEDELANLSNPEQIKAKLFQDYVADISGGRISHSVSFDEYLKTHLQSGKIKVVNNGEAAGQCLGRAPEDFDGRMTAAMRPSWLDDIEDEGPNW